MKRVLSIACLLFCIALTVSLSAQTTPPAGSAPTAGMKIATDADYAVHMKEIGQLNGVLNKSMKGGDAAEAGKAAARLEVLFKNIHSYWAAKEDRGRDDRVTECRHVVAGCAESARLERHGRRRNRARSDRCKLHVLPHGAQREVA